MEAERLRLSLPGKQAQWLLDQLNLTNGWTGRRAIQRWRAVAEGLTEKDTMELAARLFDASNTPVVVNGARLTLKSTDNKEEGGSK